MADEYAVGYGKPPKGSRFKKGRSGNPKGRPKTHRNFKTDFTTALKAPVRVTEDGKARTISKTGRRAYAMELDPLYCDVAIKRWQNFAGKDAVLAETGETFDEVVASRNTTEP